MHLRSSRSICPDRDSSPRAFCCRHHVSGPVKGSWQSKHFPFPNASMTKERERTRRRNRLGSRHDPSGPSRVGKTPTQLTNISVGITVWYSAKQGTTHRPTLHLAHLCTARLLWPREHRGQSKWVDFCWPLFLLGTSAGAGFCCCYSSSSKSSSHIALFRTLFRRCVKNQNCTDGFLLKF